VRSCSTLSNPTLENHPFSVVCDCLFNILEATVHIGVCSSIRNGRKQKVLNITTVEHIQYMPYLPCMQLERSLRRRTFGNPRPIWLCCISLKLPCKQQDFLGKTYWIQIFCFVFLYNFSLNVASAQEYLRET
jgi:hypothetical protein